jgi:hypothetical protein
MNKRATLFLLGPLLFFASAINAHAASLYIDPAFSSISRGDAITLSVRLDVDEANEECINAVDGVITYSENFAPVDVSVGDSIFSVWVEQPVIDKEKRTITFAGGLPNGYCGRIPGDPRLTNTLVKLIFRSPGFSIGAGAGNGSTTATVEFAPETTAYLNDGFGTKAPLALYGARVDLSDKAGTTIEDAWREAVVTDEVPPEKFSIELQRIPYPNGKYHAVFNTTDKQTGIDHFEVIEEPISKFAAFEWGRANAPWVVTKNNAYLLKDQSLNSTIRVKAVDKAGNEYIATLLPNEEIRTISTNDIILAGAAGLIGLLILMILLTVILGFQKRTKKKKEEASKAESNETHNESI